MTPPLHELSVAQAGAALRRGELTAAELTEAALARIDAGDAIFHAFIRVTAERARADAARADRDLAAGIDRGPLHGIPYALKDIYDTAGIVTTCNSRLAGERVPSRDAEVAAKLRHGGGVLLGKLNTHEFALGGPSFDLPFPPARNPWSPERFTGGSSSGCGAAAAAGFARVTFGSDTGGSIRSPACHCGVVGLKPTYGLVSRRGVFPLSYALDHCGPITWSVEDAALAMNVIAGHDPLDPSSAEVTVPDFAAELDRGVAGLRIGYARRLFADAEGVSPEVVAILDAAAHRLAGLGARVDEVELPDFDLFKACGRVIMIAEAYTIHEQDLKARPLDYGRYTYQRLMAGVGLSAADLTQALRLRRELTAQVNREVFSRHDAVITATSLTPPPRLKEFPQDWPPPAHAVAVQTVPFSVTGSPTLAVPAGFSRDALPVGLQIAGRPFADATVLRIGAAFEAAAGVTAVRPRWEPGADDTR